MKIYDDHSEIPADSRNYTVKNWEHPQLWETLFPHDSIPRLSFLREPVPLNLCQDTVVHDLTMTEGKLWQKLDEEETLAYFDILRRLSGSRGVVRCLEVPFTDINRIDRLLERNSQFPEIVIRIDRDTKVSKVPVSQVVQDFAGSDFYLQAAYHSSREDEMKAIQDFVSQAFDEKKVPVIRLLDVSRGVSDSYLLGIASKLKRLAEDADLPIRLRLVDSLGLWSAHPAAALPRGLPCLLHHLVCQLNYPGEWISVEPANDSGHANAVAQVAWLYGVDAVGVTLGGRGPRAGLASLESALADIVSLRSDAPRISLALLKDLENLITASGSIEKLPEKSPYLGSAVFHPRTPEAAEAKTLANVNDPSLVWGVKATQSLTPKSSRQDVVQWLRGHLGTGVVVSPEHPGIVKFTEWLMSQAGVTLTDKELLRQARRYLPGFFVMEGLSQ